MDMINTVTSKGTTTIPKFIRDELGIKPGDKIQFSQKKDGFRITKVMTLEEVRAVSAKHLTGKKVISLSDDEINDGIAQESADRHKAVLEQWDSEKNK